MIFVKMEKRYAAEFFYSYLIYVFSSVQIQSWIYDAAR